MDLIWFFKQQQPFRIEPHITVSRLVWLKLHGTCLEAAHFRIRELLKAHLNNFYPEYASKFSQQQAHIGIIFSQKHIGHKVKLTEIITGAV
jgi:hypothetical protein